MTVEQICPDKTFSQGCDFARLSNGDHAQLFEIKSCRLTQSDATRAVSELNGTKDTLKAKSLVRTSCDFSMWLIHEKKGSCRTDAIAITILQKEKIYYANSNDPGFREVYREWMRMRK